MFEEKKRKSIHTCMCNKLKFTDGFGSSAVLPNASRNNNNNNKQKKKQIFESVFYSNALLLTIMTIIVEIRRGDPSHKIMSTLEVFYLHDYTYT